MGCSGRRLRGPGSETGSVEMEEEDVFRAVGLPWISPLLREDRGELEAGRTGQLPKLVTLSDIRGDLQMHSTWSDGANSLQEMLEACRARGYEYMSITDHSQAVTVAGGLKPEAVRRQWEEADGCNRMSREFTCFGVSRSTSSETDLWICPTRSWRSWTWSWSPSTLS